VNVDGPNNIAADPRPAMAQGPKNTVFDKDKYECVHSHGMDYLAETYFGYKPISFKEVAGTGKAQKTFDQIGLAEATPYAAEDADVTLRLWKFFKPKLGQNQVAWRNSL